MAGAFLEEQSQLILLNLDGFGGAFALAGAAAQALVFINKCFAVFHFDCFGGACILAGFAAKALFGINFCCHFFSSLMFVFS